jgi:hypothetical protein
MNVAVLHNVLIAAHTVCGLAAFGLGVRGLRPRTRDEPATFRWYLGALWLMVLFLILVVALDWPDLDLAGRSIYGALTLLGLYTAWRGWRAFRDLRGENAGWQGTYVEDVGFTLIALFDGFVIVSAIDLGAPIWFVLVIGVLGVLVGRLGVGRTKERVVAGGHAG